LEVMIYSLFGFPNKKSWMVDSNYLHLPLHFAISNV
jgi:hypothetical protein